MTTTHTSDLEPQTTPREEDAPVFEEGFTPLSQMTVLKKNGRYVAVAKKNIKPGELIEKCGFVVLPYKSNEPDSRSKLLANFLPVLPCSCDACKIVGPSLVVPSGNLIFVQYHNTPNTEIKFDTSNAIIELRAATAIHKEDELFINYAGLYPKTELEQEEMFKVTDEFNAQL